MADGPVPKRKIIGSISAARSSTTSVTSPTIPSSSTYRSPPALSSSSSVRTLNNLSSSTSKTKIKLSSSVTVHGNSSPATRPAVVHSRSYSPATISTDAPKLGPVRSKTQSVIETTGGVRIKSPFLAASNGGNERITVSAPRSTVGYSGSTAGSSIGSTSYGSSTNGTARRSSTTSSTSHSQASTSASSYPLPSPTSASFSTSLAIPPPPPQLLASSKPQTRRSQSITSISSVMAPSPTTLRLPISLSSQASSLSLLPSPLLVEPQPPPLLSASMHRGTPIDYFGSPPSFTALEPERRGSLGSEGKEEREEAKINRKIADLEISNASLLAVNRLLEATKVRQSREISDLRRRLRTGSIHPPSSSHLSPSSPPMDRADPSDESDEESTRAYTRSMAMLTEMIKVGTETFERIEVDRERGLGSGGVKEKGRVLNFEEAKVWEGRDRIDDMKVEDQSEEGEDELGGDGIRKRTSIVWEEGESAEINSSEVEAVRDENGNGHSSDDQGG